MELSRAVAAIPVVLASLALAAPAQAARCPHADSVAGGSVSRQVTRDTVLCLINQQRGARHLPPLHANHLLDNSAQAWSNAMVLRANFTHGPNFAARISAAGYLWSAAAENIATGFETPRQVVTAWMASPDHCQNILDPTYSDVGTGVNSHRLGQYGPSTWTQDFGLWMGHSSPSHNYAPQHGCPYKI